MTKIISMNFYWTMAHNIPTYICVRCHSKINSLSKYINVTIYNLVSLLPDIVVPIRKIEVHFPHLSIKCLVHLYVVLIADYDHWKNSKYASLLPIS